MVDLCLEDLALTIVQKRNDVNHDDDKPQESPFMTMLIHIQFKTTGASFWRGRSSRVVDLAGSMPSALDGGRSVTKIRKCSAEGSS